MVVKGVYALSRWPSYRTAHPLEPVRPWASWPSRVVMGIGIAGIGFGIAHDALHGAYTSHSRLTIFGLSFDALGASSYLWKITHNIVHHTYTNIHGVDEDLAVSPLLRLSPNAERPWFHRLQHSYAFPLYACTTLTGCSSKDYGQFLRAGSRPLPGQAARHRAGRDCCCRRRSSTTATLWPSR